MNHITSFQFLRFLAFMLIFLFHSAHFEFLPNLGGGAAASAVSFFILLSGFLAGFASYGKNIICSGTEIRNYTLKKLKKFYPLYISTTIIALLYSGIKSYLFSGNMQAATDLLIQLLKNSFLIQSWFPTGYFAFNSASWFLSSMMLLYLCKVPLTCLIYKISRLRIGNFLLIGLFLLLSCLFFTYCYSIGQTAYSNEFWLYIFPPARLLEFTCGMICGFLMHSLVKKITNSHFLLCSILEIFSLFIWYLAYSTQTVEWECRSLRWFLPNLLILCIFSLNAGILSRIFSLKWLKYLGDISFESYLLHQVILTLCSYATGYLAPYMILPSGLLQMICLGTTIVLSHFIYHLPVTMQKLHSHNAKVH